MEITFRCGHTIELDHIGRGKAREARAAKVAQLACEACSRKHYEEEAARCTDIHGNPTSIDQQAAVVERWMKARLVRFMEYTRI
jgi:hypothetical protein